MKVYNVTVLRQAFWNDTWLGPYALWTVKMYRYKNGDVFIEAMKGIKENVNGYLRYFGRPHKKHRNEKQS